MRRHPIVTAILVLVAIVVSMTIAVASVPHPGPIDSTEGAVSASAINRADTVPDLTAGAAWTFVGFQEALDARVQAHLEADRQAAEAEAEAEAQAEADRQAAVASSAPGAPPTFSSSTGDGQCANPIIPEDVARGESGCRWDAYNAKGCADPLTGIPRGCIGFYQLDAGHFYEVSPWNPSVSGSCYGIDPSTPAGQTECASRLGPGAWG